MEEINKDSAKKNANNKFIKLFFDKFSKERNEIFQYMYDLLEANNLEDEKEKEKELIQNIIKSEKINNKNKINTIKKIKKQKYLKNIEANYKPDELGKYNLGLIYEKLYPIIKLVYYKNNENFINNNNIEDDNANNSKACNKNEKKDKEKNEIIILFNIDFITKIKIKEDEEWICNSEYALYLFDNIYKLKNPHPSISDDDEFSDDSSYSLTEKLDIDHFVLITNNKKKKNVIEIEANLNISTIYEEIKKKKHSFYNNEYIKYSIPDLDIKDLEQENFEVNEIYSYFTDLYNYQFPKIIIFQDKNDLNSFQKLVLLNSQYLDEKIRFLYLDLNILNNIKNTNEKRNYLSYYIARIFDCYDEFKSDFETFVNENLKNIRDKYFINNFIDKIIEKNNKIMEKNDTPFYLIIDNIECETNFHVVEKLLNTEETGNIRVYGIINIDTNFGKNKFIELKNKKINERGKNGYYVRYLYSNNCERIKIDNLDKFLKDIGNNINAFKDFIQLIYYKEYINECSYIDNNFLMKYIQYLKLIIEEKDQNCLYIQDIQFKNEEIKNKFILNYKNILLSYLNSNNDEIISQLFSDVNGIFFEKQIILDILLNKIKNDHHKNFKELNVHSIYCMNLDINKIDINEYKKSNIIIIQDNKTGEIYDFGIIVDNSIKLYQVSNKKTKEDLEHLNRNLIEVDCGFMNKKCLNKIGDYKNFNFGIITSMKVFNEYLNLMNQKKELEIQNKNNLIEQINNKITKTSYYLMKDYCQKNNYELLIYDLNQKKVYVENDLNNLTEYDLYNFQENKKLNIPNLDNVFELCPNKLSIKNIKKNEFIKKLNDTKFFSGLENDENKKSLDIVGKFDYNNQLLNIEEINADNYCIYISGKKYNEKNKNLEIVKYKKETKANEISEGGRILCKDNNLNINKKKSEVILFHLEGKIKFIGNKRERNSNK